MGKLVTELKVLAAAKKYAALNTEYQTRVKFLSKDEQIRWHEENSA